jgi:hypothetical protein
MQLSVAAACHAAVFSEAPPHDMRRLHSQGKFVAPSHQKPVVSYLWSQCKAALQADSSVNHRLTFYRFFTADSHLLVSMKVRKPQWLGGYLKGKGHERTY